MKKKIIITRIFFARGGGIVLFSKLSTTLQLHFSHSFDLIIPSIIPCAIFATAKSRFWKAFFSLLLASSRNLSENLVDFLVFAAFSLINKLLILSLFLLFLLLNDFLQLLLQNLWLTVEVWTFPKADIANCAIYFAQICSLKIYEIWDFFRTDSRNINLPRSWYSLVV